MDGPGLPQGYSLISLDSVDSTNAEALRRLARGAGHGTVVWARMQSAGRGRRGRAWASPPGNLYATLIVRPERGAALGQLAFVAALGAGEALGDTAPVRYKWPNDLLLNGAKVGGILIEAVAGAAVVGLGVNLASAPDDTPYPATSLADQGLGPVDPGVLLGLFCRRFEAWYGRWRSDGFAAVRAAWLAGASGIGERIEARLAATTVRGRFMGLDADGGLMLERPDGGREVITAGEIFPAPPESD